MEVVFFLIPISILILCVAIWAFCWAVNHEQFSDTTLPAYQIIFDDKEARAMRDINHG